MGDDGLRTAGRSLGYDTVDNVLQEPFENHFHCYGLLPESLQGISFKWDSVSVTEQTHSRSHEE